MSRSELDVLYREHHDIAEFLDILERQFDSLDRGGSPDWQILSDLLNYLIEQPDSDHNRFETRLLQRLAQRAPHCTCITDALLEHHHRLLADGLQLGRLLEGIMGNQVVPRSTIARLGGRFVRDYRLLIERENSEVFPAFARHLRASDWVELVTDRYWRSSLDRSPLPQYDSEHETLRRSIAFRAGGSWPSVVAGPACCPVCDGE